MSELCRVSSKGSLILICAISFTSVCCCIKMYYFLPNSNSHYSLIGLNVFFLISLNIIVFGKTNKQKINQNKTKNHISPSFILYVCITEYGEKEHGGLS